MVHQPKENKEPEEAIAAQAEVVADAQPAVPLTEQDKIENILIDRKEVGYWRGRI